MDILARNTLVIATEITDGLLMDQPIPDNGSSAHEAPLRRVGPAMIDRPDIQRLFLVLALLLLGFGGWNAVIAGRSPTSRVQNSQSTGFRVNVNSATAEELSLLPQVGPVLADRIVVERETHGPFLSVEDLGRTRGIGPERISELRPLITIDR